MALCHHLSTSTTISNSNNNSDNGWTNRFKPLLTPPVTLLNIVYFHWITQWTEIEYWCSIERELKRTPNHTSNVILWTHIAHGKHFGAHGHLTNNQIHTIVTFSAAHRGDYTRDSLRLCHIHFNYLWNAFYMNIEQDTHLRQQDVLRVWVRDYRKRMFFLSSVMILSMYVCLCIF